MRKALACFLVLLLLLSAGTVYAARTAMAPADKVTFTREHLYGDSNAADGFTIKPMYSLRSSATWVNDITFAADGLETSTDFRLTSPYELQYESADFFQGVSITTTAGGSQWLFSDYANSYLRFPKIKDCFDHMAPASEASLSLKFCELYKTYPLSVSVQMDQINYGYWEEQDINSADATPENENADFLMKHFPIPVPESQLVKITLRKNEDGTLGELGMDFGYNETDFYKMENYSVCKDASAYFCFNNHTYLGNKVDTNELPLGYGIYKLFIENEEQSLSLLCPLDPDETVLRLTMDAERNYLLLFSKTEDMRLILHQIDVETGKMIHDVEIGRFERPEDFEYMNFKEMDHCIMLCIGERAYVLEPDDASGIWKCDFSPVILDDGFYQTCLPWYRLDWPTTHKIEYDGKHLAISWNTFNREIDESPDGVENPYYVNGLSFSTCVYDKEKVVYYGITRSGLGKAARDRNGLTCIHPRNRLD